MAYVLEMRDIVKKFPGVVALDHAQLTLQKGEIHAVIGENGAGKSTLMKVLLGIYSADSGECIFNGRNVRFSQPAEALAAGITMIHQEISMMPNLDVAGNIWIAREKQFVKNGLIDHKRMHEATTLLLDKLGVELDPYAKAKNLSIAQLQMVELCRAVSYDAEIIIMDEPTSALTEKEIRILFGITRNLASKGVTIVYISHKLEEIYELCDRITVMRDGRFIKTGGVKEIGKRELISLIAGRELENLYPKETVTIGKTVLEVKGLKSEGVFNDISFSVRKGEVLGFCGLVGSGRTEIMRAIFGVDRLDDGRILIDGREVHIQTPKDAIREGIGFVTEDRLRLGCIGKLSLKHNITLANLAKYCRIGFIKGKEEEAASEKMMNTIKVKASSQKQLISQLSGGNQQKVIIGRSLLANPKVLILDEPTRGIDVGSRSEIYKIISDLAHEGVAILAVSSEVQELLGICDRIIVICHGKMTGQFDARTVTQRELMTAAFGQNVETEEVKGNQGGQSIEAE